MRYEIRMILASMMMTLMALQAFGETPSDSVKVYVRVGHRQSDPTLDNNQAVMDSFVNKVRKAYEDDNIGSIVVSGFVSPDSTSSANENISLLRCRTIADHISENAGIDRDFIHIIPGGMSWEELRRMVESDPNVQSEDKVLDILNNTPIWIFNAEGKIIDGRKAQLVSFSRGIPYSWILKNIFPELKNAVAVSLFLKEDYNNSQNHPLNNDKVNPNIQGNNPDIFEDIPDHTNEYTDIIVITYISETNATDIIDAQDTQNTVETSNDNALNAEISTEASNVLNSQDSIDASDVADETNVPDGNVSGEESDIKTGPLHRFALKNNILYDGALLPNLEIEWMFKENWSVAIEGDLAWWRKKVTHKYYDLAMVSAECRRWFSVKKPWHGFYAGVFAGGGKYDLENGGKGYYGEGGMAGISAGYMFPIGKCLSLEAAIGAGYMMTKYKEYYPLDGHYIYQRTKSLNYFGPLKLKFAIVWRFLD